MRADVLDSGGGRRRAVLGVGFVASAALHAAVAFAVSSIPPGEPKAPVWIEAAVNISEPPPPEPPPERPPEPEPEPEKPKPPPEPETYEKLPEPPPEPPPDAPPPPERKVVRVTQGLSASSFAVGGNTGLTVRAGTTTAARPTDDRMTIDEADVSVPYASAATPPKLKNNPPLVVPPEVIDQRIEGRVEVELTLAADGTVLDVTVVGALHPAADAACVAHARKTRWTPLQRNGEGVSVKGVPFSCRFEQVQD